MTADLDGNAVAWYTYDAWGNILDYGGELARANPITYRGYYWDWATGLFYLQSRYYDPSLRRFISADVYMDTGQQVLGTNMYMYCLNDPVNLYDPTGFSGEAAAIWGGTMWWLKLIDGPLPFGDIIFWSGLAILGTAAIGAVDEIATTMPRTQTQTRTQARTGAQTRAETAERAIADTIANAPPGVHFWAARTHRGVVSIGEPLTTEQAIERVQSGGDVFAISRFHAHFLGIAAGRDDGFGIWGDLAGPSRSGRQYNHVHVTHIGQRGPRMYGGVHIYYLF